MHRRPFYGAKSNYYITSKFLIDPKRNNIWTCCVTENLPHEKNSSIQSLEIKFCELYN